LEEGNENVFIDLWTEIADEDGVFWAAVISIEQSVCAVMCDGCKDEEYEPGF